MRVLERQNGRLWLAFLAAVALPMTGLLMGMNQKRARVVEAESFVLVDSRGKGRASLAVAEGAVTLGFFDRNDKIRLRIGVVDDAPALGFFDRSGKDRLHATITSEGPTLGFFDQDGRVRLNATVTRDVPTLGFLDADKLRLQLGLPNDLPSLSVFDRSKHLRIMLGLGPDGDSPEFSFGDAKGTPQTSLRPDSLLLGSASAGSCCILSAEEERPRLLLGSKSGANDLSVVVDEAGACFALLDGKRNQRCALLLRSRKPSLSLHDQDASVLWREPK